MKLELETKLLKRNKEMSKKFGIDVMTGNFDVIVNPGGKFWTHDM